MSFRKRVFSVIFVALSVAPTFSQGLFEESFSKTDESGSIETYSIEGNVRSNMYATQDEKDSVAIVAGYVIPEIKLTAKKKTLGKAFADLRIIGGYNSKKSILNFDLREAYVNVTPGNFDITMGKKIIVWGRADGTNPTNNITPMNYNYHFRESDEIRNGNFLTRIAYNWNKVTLEGIWVPFYSADQFPYDNFSLPNGISISENEEFPDWKFTNGSYALKMSFQFQKVDGSLSYYDGYFHTPAFKTLFNTDMSVLLTPYSYRTMIFGGDFSTAVKSVGIRSEVAYKYPHDDYNDIPYIPNPQLEYILGVDKSIADINFIVQYVGKTVFDRDNYLDETPPSDPTNPLLMQQYLYALTQNKTRDLNRLFSDQKEKAYHSISANIDRSFAHDKLNIALRGNYNFTSEEYRIMPEISYQITDALSLFVGGIYMNGPDETLTYLTKDLFNSVYTELKLNF